MSKIGRALGFTDEKVPGQLSVGRILLLSLPFAWISVFNSVMDNGMPVILTAPLSDGGLGMSFTAKGVVMALDNIFALFLMPIFGRLSDNSKNKHGKRRPYILTGGAGAILSWLIAGIFLGLGAKWPFIITLALGLAFIALSRPASLALLPDFTPNSQRRSANALTQIVSIVCTVIGIGLISLFSPISYHYIFYGTAVVMVVFLVLYILKVHESKWEHPKEEPVSEDSNAYTGSAPSLRNSIVLLVSVFFFYMAYNGLTSSLSNYATDVLHLSKRTFVLPEAFTLLMAVVLAVPVAKISNRFHRKTSIIAGQVLMLIAFALAGTQQGLTVLMFVAFLLAGAGYAACIVNLYPCMLEFSSPKRLGTATAAFNTVMMLAMVVTPILSGILADRYTMRILFPYCIAALVLSLATLFFMRERHEAWKVNGTPDDATDAAPEPED